MTPIEFMALIVAMFGIVKLVIILVNPQIWMNYVVKRFWANSAIATIISLVISSIALLFLLREITIVHIFASMLFFIFLIAIGIAPFSRDFLPVIERRILKDKNIWKKNWLSILLWTIIILWLLYTIFNNK